MFFDNINFFLLEYQLGNDNIVEPSLLKVFNHLNYIEG